MDELSQPLMVSRADADSATRMLQRPESICSKCYGRFLATGKPAILHLRIDPEAVTPTMSLTAIREKALAGRG